jgi:hypothetical protein
MHIKMKATTLKTPFTMEGETVPMSRARNRNDDAAIRCRLPSEAVLRYVRA